MREMIASRRKAERQTCIVEARAYVEGRQAVRCRIQDLTPMGAKLIAEENVPRDARILLYIPSIGELWAALVRWRRGRTFGVEFMRREADFATAEDVAEPDTFALRLQVAQVVDATQRTTA